MDLTLKIAIIGAIAMIITALIKLLGDLLGKGSPAGLIATVIIVILSFLGGGVFVFSLPTTTTASTGGGDIAPAVLQGGNASTTNPLAGSWVGTIQSPDGSFSTELNLSFDSSCEINDVCGTYDAYQLSCSGTLTLVSVDGDTFIFRETKTQGADWCGFCYEHIQKLSADRISYGCSNTGISRDIQSTGILSRR